MSKMIELHGLKYVQGGNYDRGPAIFINPAYVVSVTSGFPVLAEHTGACIRLHGDQTQQGWMQVWESVEDVTALLPHRDLMPMIRAETIDAPADEFANEPRKRWRN